MKEKNKKSYFVTDLTTPGTLCNSVVIIFFMCSLSLLSPLYAQEASEEIKEQIATEKTDEEEQTEAQDDLAQEEPAKEEADKDVYTGRLTLSERNRIEMEIKSSTLSELAVWCRQLGLSEGGTREEMAARIRGHFEMPAPKEKQSGSNEKILTIESAETNRYFTISEIDEDYAILKGNVYITLKDGESIHKIKADEILFNSTRHILTARGGVVYEKVDPDKTETFRGENITVNIDNWSSTFLDGSSTMESDGTAYLFSGTVISRTDQDVTILKDAVISSTFDDEAYWSINASKLWLLPGSDFVILNAVLKVGVIPVLYIPFFFFPTNQLVFHPVLGYRTREGGFVQTTTYILGQPRADTSQSSSLSRILGNSNDMQLEREGLFLRSSGKKVVNPNEVSLRAMLDYYVNLGTYIGFELTTPKAGILNQLNLTLGIGLTRTISYIDGQYTPYAPNFDGTFEENHSNFFSLEVPFRYRMKFESSISGSLGSLSWSFPYYSDPYVDRDFLNRAESMDWVKMLIEGAAVEEILTADTEIQPYIWTMSGNLNQSFTLLAPYISKMDLSTISTTLSFQKLADSTAKISNNNPNRFFFAPDKWTIVSLSGSINGNPLSLGGTGAAASQKPAFTLPEDPLHGIGVPISPWPDAPAKEGNTQSSDTIIPPVLRQTFSLPSTGNMRYNIDYQITPTFSSELQFMNTLNGGTNRWNTYEDVDWAFQSILGNIGLNANINFRADHSSGLFSNTASIAGNSIWREYFDINEEHFTDSNGVVNEDEMAKMRRAQFSQTNYQSSYSYTGSFRPLQFSQFFKQTSLSYSFRGTLVRSKRYNEIDSPKDGPELNPEWGSWVKEETKDGVFIPGLNSHQLSATLGASIMDQNQTISFSANLPPLDERISASASFRLWISDTSVSTSMDKLTETTLTQALKDKEKKVGDWLIRPIIIRETLTFSKNANLGLNMTIDPEEEYEFTNISSNLKLWDFRLNFLANKVIKSEFEPFDKNNPQNGGSWKQDPTKELELLPRELSLSYSKSFSNIEIVRNWVGFNFTISSSLAYNLQQYTNSNFSITLSSSFRVAGFLDLSLSATSYNKVIWRYFKEIPGMEDLTIMYNDGPQNNFFTDLFDSFNFSDVTKRENSGFKMQSFNINATHHLGDWTATLGISMYQYNDTSVFPPKFTIVSDISFTVQWKPITEIKSNIRYDGKKETWTVE